MKRILISALLIIGLSYFKADAQVSNAPSNAGYMAALDTLIDADTTTYIQTITGSKSEVSFQYNTLKINGTVAGTIKIYGSVDGINYETTPVISDTLVNQSNNYVYTRTSNGYVKYKCQFITSGTVHVSVRGYILWRQ